MIKILQLNHLCRTKNRLRCIPHSIIRDFSGVHGEKTSNFVIVSRQDSLRGSRDKTLGPLNPFDPKFPLPGNVGLVSSVKPTGTLASRIAKAKDLIHATKTLPVHKEDHYQTVLTQAFINEQFNAESSKSQPIVYPIPQSLQLPKTESPDALTISHDNSISKLHPCPHLLKLSLMRLLPNKDLNAVNLTTITQTYKTGNSNIELTPALEAERESLADHFIAHAIELCAALKEMGYWADFIDPRTGKPYLNRHNIDTDSYEVISENHPCFEQLGFEVDCVGCCKVVRHKLFENNFFAGLILTDAPRHHPVLAEYDTL